MLTICAFRPYQDQIFEEEATLLKEKVVSKQHIFCYISLIIISIHRFYFDVSSFFHTNYRSHDNISIQADQMEEENKELRRKLSQIIQYNKKSKAEVTSSAPLLPATEPLKVSHKFFF